MSDEMTYEYEVVVDGDPNSVVTYRGPDEDRARRELDLVKPVSGWGAILRRRLVGEYETVGTHR